MLAFTQSAWAILTMGNTKSFENSAMAVTRQCGLLEMRSEFRSLVVIISAALTKQK
jgi:hypothetical protein